MNYGVGQDAAKMEEGQCLGRADPEIMLIVVIERLVGSNVQAGDQYLLNIDFHRFVCAVDVVEIENRGNMCGDPESNAPAAVVKKLDPPVPPYIWNRTLPSDLSSI